MVWAPDYITAAELRAWARIPDSADDAEIATAISAASRAIDGFCRRTFGAVDDATVWHAADRSPYALRGRWAVEIPDLFDDTDMAVTDPDGVTDVTADVRLEPLNAPMEGKPWTRLTFPGATTWTCDPAGGLLAVSALWGWPEVPAGVVQACKIQAHRFLVRRDSPYGVAGSPNTGSELRLAARLDPDVRTALAATGLRRLGMPG